MKTPKTMSETAKVIADRNAKNASKKKTMKAKTNKDTMTAADHLRIKEATELLKSCGFHEVRPGVWTGKLGKGTSATLKIFPKT